MNPWVTFIIGLLVGWLAEWVIDWLYWRRKDRDDGWRNDWRNGR